jgi:hypothetical protein
MIERRAARRTRPVADVPGEDGGTGELPAPGRPSPAQDEEDEALASGR